MKKNKFKNKFLNNIYTEHKLAKYTWFGVGGNAEILFIPEEEICIEKFLKENLPTVIYLQLVLDLIYW